MIGAVSCRFSLRKRPFKAIVSVVVIWSFLLNTVSYDLVWAAKSTVEPASPYSIRAGSPDVSSANKLKTLDPATFSIPVELGVVRDSWAAPSVIANPETSSVIASPESPSVIASDPSEARGAKQSRLGLFSEKPSHPGSPTRGLNRSTAGIRLRPACRSHTPRRSRKEDHRPGDHHLSGTSFCHDAPGVGRRVRADYPLRDLARYARYPAGR